MGQNGAFWGIVQEERKAESEKRKRMTKGNCAGTKWNIVEPRRSRDFAVLSIGWALTWRRYSVVK
jgi:hypothetical protein